MTPCTSPKGDGEIDDEQATGSSDGASKMGQAAAFKIGEEASAGRGMAARDQVRRLSHARSPGPRQGSAADAYGPRLDAQLPTDSRGRVHSPGNAGVSRWGA